MAVINQTPIRFVENNTHIRKVPVALPGEGFYYHHFPLDFTVQSIPDGFKATHNGFVYLTSRRLIFIASKSSPQFESFGISLYDVQSLKSNWVMSNRVSQIRIVTLDGEEYLVRLEFSRKDVARSVVFRDYLKMIMETTAGKVDPRVTLTSVSELNGDLPPAYEAGPPTYDETLLTIQTEQ